MNGKQSCDPLEVRHRCPDDLGVALGLTRRAVPGKSARCVVLATLLALPPGVSGILHATEANLYASDAVHGQQEGTQDQSDREQERRDREQEARDREQERRDREQEARERDQEKKDRLYEDGREALDEERYDKAEAKFAQLAQLSGPQTDAALYWKAYAQNRQGKRDAALATIADLKQRFPQSRWQKDASALQIEVQQRTGQPLRPEAESDEELKILAIHGLMNSDPERALPLLEKVLNGPATPKEKSKALFVIAQSGSPQAKQILGRIASGEGNPDLQRKAVEYLGIFGGAESRKTLADVYAKTGEQSVKRAILRSYMISGDKERLFAAAKDEKSEDLRREAIRQLGIVHGVSELQQLYQRESSTAVRRELLQAFFLVGDAQKLVEVAESEKDAELRRTAVRNLGLINSADSAKALQTIYGKEQDHSVRAEVLNAYFLQGNASALIAIARSEKDAELKKAAVSKLALMHNKEATDYLMEILQK